MLARWFSFAAALALAVAVPACKKAEERQAPSTAEKAEPEPAMEPAPPMDPPPAPAPADPAKLLADLEKCESELSCDAYKPLVALGAKVSASLAKIATDAGKPAKAREVAAKALAEIKDPAQGKALLDAAKAEKDFMLRGELFAAAGASGNPEVLAAAGAHLVTDEGWDQRIEVRKAIAPFGKKAFEWALGQLGAVKESRETAIADVLAETATDADLAALKPLLGKAKDPMSRNRIASRLVALGDLAALEVLYKHLADKDVYVRSDAGNFLAPVAAKVPAADKKKVVDLVTAAKAKDQGGLTSRGYDDLLKALK